MSQQTMISQYFLSDIQGEWYLVASASMKSVINFVNDEDLDPTGVAIWLNGFDEARLSEVKATSGLVLSIKPDGTFTEVVSGRPEVCWFDENGVLEEQVTPFNGHVATSGAGAYLRPTSVAEWAEPVEGRYAPAVLRYDDGDTKISDHVRRHSGRLVRTINIVTDELYLDRVIMVYDVSCPVT